jgi:hypothetical protein
MWPVLPKDCNCTETASNTGAVCNALYTSNQFFYNGINSICNDLQNGDDLSVVIQKLENFLCSIEVTQVFLTYLEENIEEFPEFVTLVNTSIACETIENCFTPTTTTTSSSSTTTTTSTSTSTTTTTTSSTTSTTTTTTTAVPECISYVVEATLPLGSWNATSCETDEFVGGILLSVGETSSTGCVYDNSLVLSGVRIISDGPCSTTTTTSSSTTTTTSSTSTTTTTTTLYPCVEGQLLIINNTENELSEIYSTPDTWLVGISVPVSAFSYSTGIQGGTNNPISVDITYVEPGCVSMYINTVLIQSIPFFWSDTYTFDPVSISSEDCVWFIINTEC